MNELTVFSIPKRDEGHIQLIQKNAISSWVALGANVLLFGDVTPELLDVSWDKRVQVIPSISTTALGTPLLSDAFAQAARRCRSRLLCYANADIILPLDLRSSLMRIKMTRFLAISQRWDLDIVRSLDFTDRASVSAFESMARNHAELHPAAGSDIFIYPRDLDWGMPPFAVGRPTWDNWLIYRARKLRVPVIDLTPSAFVIHQNHGYQHVPHGSGESYEGPEAESNREILGSTDLMFTIEDATHELREKGVVKRLTYRALRRRVSAARILHPRLDPLYRVLMRIRAPFR